MTVHGILAGPCLVAHCPERSKSNLGVCEAHWFALTPELRHGWQHAWRDDARMAAWTTARRQCLEYLNAHAS